MNKQSIPDDAQQKQQPVLGKLIRALGFCIGLAAGAAAVAIVFLSLN